MPRPNLYSPEIHRAICDALRDGNYRATAAKAAGIAESTLHVWLNRARDGVAPYVGLLEDIEMAEAQAEISLVGEIRRGDESGWQRLGWMLERRWPGRWAARVRATVTEEVGTIVTALRSDPEMHRRVLVAVDEAAPGTVSGTH